jgi:hypothetical protein
MIEEGLWLDRRRRLPPVHQPRNRRSRIGELIQIDGSDHDWFEGRAPRCSLIAYALAPPFEPRVRRPQHLKLARSEAMECPMTARNGAVTGTTERAAR